MLPLLAVALCGQYGAAHVHHQACGHQTYNYGQQTYGHAQTYQHQHQHQHNAAFFAADPSYYAATVASYIKKQAEQAAAAQAQADLAAKVNQINDGLLKLTTQFSAALATPDPAPQPQYQAPPLASPQQPPVPDKAPPLATPQQPYAAPTPPPFASDPRQVEPRSSTARPAKFPSLVSAVLLRFRPRRSPRPLPSARDATRARVLAVACSSSPPPASSPRSTCPPCSKSPTRSSRAGCRPGHRSSPPSDPRSWRESRHRSCRPSSNLDR
jgi:hypothetical protein